MRFSKLRPTRAIAPFAAAILTLTAISGAYAADIKILVDQARIIKLKQAGAGVIVGNPSIADVSVQNERLLVVTGKSFGVTNLIVLDGRNRQILNKRVSVGQDANRIVTLNKGPLRFSYSCKPTCQPALAPGDEQKFFDNAAKGAQTKMGLAQSAADGSQAPQ